MNFQSLSKINNSTVSRILNASSWGTCVAFLEGTGEEISSINSILSNVTVIVNSPSSTNCYSVTLQDLNTQVFSNYILFENNMTDLNNWIAQQTDKNLISIQLSEKSYVAV